MRKKSLFLYFLLRDLYAQRSCLIQYIINYTFIIPFFTTIGMGYIQPNVSFAHTNPQLTTLLFTGSILLTILVITYKLSAPLFFDILYDRFIDYQITIMHPRLFITEHVLFTTLFSFILAFPFFSMGKLILGTGLDTTLTNWYAVFVMLFCTALLGTTYNLLAVCIMKHPGHTEYLWMRINLPLMFLGGFTVPWHIMMRVSPFLGYVTLLNPLLYMTEGLRQAFIGGPQFLSLWICITVLCAWSAILFMFTLIVFKKRMDHI